MGKYNNLYYLKVEIEELEAEIKNLTEIGSSKITGMPHSSIVGNPTEQFYLKKEKLTNKLNKTLEKYVDELNKTLNFIEEINDPEIRIIARLRLVQNLKWEQIARKVNLDRSVCFRKLNKYLKGECK